MMFAKPAIFDDLKGEIAKILAKNRHILAEIKSLIVFKIPYKASLMAFLSSSSLILPNLLLVDLPLASMMMV